VILGGFILFVAFNLITYTTFIIISRISKAHSYTYIKYTSYKRHKLREYALEDRFNYVWRGVASLRLIQDNLTA
jgi:hypothetical protein